MNNRNREIPNQTELPPPRFDEHAHLRAQPVRPIRKNRITQLFEEFFSDSSRSVALIVILGFLTGALIGLSLVGQNTSPPEPDQALVIETQNEAVSLQGAQVGVYGIQTARPNIRAAASRRARLPNIGQPRAYRFAVIR